MQLTKCCSAHESGAPGAYWTIEGVESMSMIECGHCRRTADARTMTECARCGAMICENCQKSGEDCESSLDIP
jgi:hypothetical protein